MEPSEEEDLRRIGSNIRKQNSDAKAKRLVKPLAFFSVVSTSPPSLALANAIGEIGTQQKYY